MPGDFIATDQRFHLTLARATRNFSLVMLLEPILRPLHGRMRETLRIPETAEQAVDEHERIVQALHARDADGAAAAMAAHPERRVYPSLLGDVVASFPDHVWGIDPTFVRFAKGWSYLMLDSAA